MGDERELMRRVAIVGSTLGALSAVWAMVTHGAPAALSVATGSAVGVANAAAITRIITRLVDHRADALGSAQMRAGVFLVFKSAALFALVGLIVTRPFINIGWFTVGITTSVLALILGGLWASPPASGAPIDTDKGTH